LLRADDDFPTPPFRLLKHRQRIAVDVPLKPRPADRTFDTSDSAASGTVGVLGVGIRPLLNVPRSQLVQRQRGGDRVNESLQKVLTPAVRGRSLVSLRPFQKEINHRDDAASRDLSANR